MDTELLKSRRHGLVVGLLIGIIVTILFVKAVTAQCLSQEAYEIVNTTKDLTNSTVDLAPLLIEIDQLCNQLNITKYQQDANYVDLLQINQSTTDFNSNTTGLQTEFDQLSTNLDQRIENLKGNLTVLEDLVDDIESVYASTGYIKTHNDTMKAYVAQELDNLPQNNMMYVYAGMIIMMFFILGLAWLQYAK